MEVKYQVFVSSTFEDLKEERKEVCQAILESHCIPAGMELFPASNKTQWDFIKRVIDESDFYLLIVAGKYGSIGINDEGENVSYTEMEFDHALNQDKPIIALVYADTDNLPKSKVETTKKGNYQLDRFRKKVRSGRIVKKWHNKDDLRACVLTALNEMRLDTSATGWIKADFTVDKLSFDFLEQEREKHKEIVSTKDKEYSILLSRLNEKEDIIKRISISHENEIRKLNDKIARLMNRLKKANIVVMEREDLFIKIVELNFSYNTMDDHDLIADLASQFDLQCDMRFFLSNCCKDSLWWEVTQNARRMLLEYNYMDSRQKIAFLKEIFISYEKFTGGDAYCIDEPELSELLRYLFFFVSLNQSDSDNELIKSKTTQILYVFDRLIDDIWNAELCLSENDV